MQLMKRTLKKVRYTYIRRPHRKKAMICIDSVGYYMVGLYSVCIRWKSEKLQRPSFKVVHVLILMYLTALSYRVPLPL